MNRNAEEEAVGGFDINQSYHTSGSDVRLPDDMFDKPKPLPPRAEYELLRRSHEMIGDLLTGVPYNQNDLFAAENLLQDIQRYLECNGLGA